MQSLANVSQSWAKKRMGFILDLDGQNNSPDMQFYVYGIGSARWPDGPLPSRVAQGFNLIPVSGVREAVGGSDEKIGGKVVEGTFNKDMTNNGMIVEAHKQIVKPLSQTCNHIWRAQACATRKSSLVCVR